MNARSSSTYPHRVTWSGEGKRCHSACGSSRVVYRARSRSSLTSSAWSPYSSTRSCGAAQEAWPHVVNATGRSPRQRRSIAMSS